MLEIEALHHPAQLDVPVAPDQLERDFLAGVAGGVINFAEPPVPDAALDRVAGQRPGSGSIGKPAARGWRRSQRGRAIKLAFVGLCGVEVHRFGPGSIPTIVVFALRVKKYA